MLVHDRTVQETYTREMATTARKAQMIRHHVIADELFTVAPRVHLHATPVAHDRQTLPCFVINLVTIPTLAHHASGGCPALAPNVPLHAACMANNAWALFDAVIKMVAAVTSHSPRDVHIRSAG